MAITELDRRLKIANAKKHDQRYFAMLNDAVAVTGNEQLEGGNGDDALKYYQYLLELELPDCPFTLNQNEAQNNLLHKRLNNLQRMYKRLGKFYENRTLFKPSDISDIILAINADCFDAGAAYLPSGYIGSPGHFAGLKVRKLENGNYAFSCINHGAGMLYHPDLSEGMSRKKTSYQSYEYEIDLTRDNGKTFLKKILELRYDQEKAFADQSKFNAFSADDLYGALELHGTRLAEIPKLNEKGVTTLRGGTCSMTNTHALARDCLIDSDVDVNTRKRYHFIIKLRSLIDGFNKYLNNECDFDVLQWGLTEFSVRINKYKGLLSDKEIIYCGEIQAKINERLQEDANFKIAQNCQPAPFPDASGKAPLQLTSVFDERREKKTEETLETQPTPPRTDTAIPKTIKAEDVSNLLDFVYHYDRNKPFPLDYSYDILNALPHCSGEDKDAFWDKVSETDIFFIIDHLGKISEHLKSSANDSPQARGRAFAMAMIIYDITAQLLKRPNLKTKMVMKIGPDYALALDDVYSEQTFFNDPVDFHTVKRVADNFETRSAGKKRIFTNAVSDDTTFDYTVHFVMRKLLNEKKRECIAQEKMKKEQAPNARYSDLELFEFLMENPHLSYTRKNGMTGWILKSDYQDVLKIAGTAHALGDATTVYHKDKEDKVSSFKKNKYHQDLKRQAAFENQELSKYIPNLHDNDEDNETHQDLSENMIHQPENHRNKMQKKLVERNFADRIEKASKEKLRLQPIQIMPAGSLNPDSEIWEPPKKQALIFEALDEALRHLECAPHLKVVRVLTYATDNLDKLIVPEVRIRLNEMLFQYENLDNAINYQFEPLILNMNHFLEALIIYCHENAPTNNDLLMWGANIAHDLRYHIEVAAKLYNFSLDKFSIPSFHLLLLQRMRQSRDANERSLIASQIIRDFRNTSPISLENCCLLLTCRMIANLCENAATSAKYWETFNAEVLSMINDHKEKATILLNQLLSTYSDHDGANKQQWQLQENRLMAVGADFQIDLTKGKLEKKSDKTSDIKERTKKTMEDNTALFEYLSLNIENVTLLYDFNANQKILSSKDGRWEFEYIEKSTNYAGTVFEITETYQYLNIEGRRVKCQLIRDNEIADLFGKESNPFESDSEKGRHYQYWYSSEEHLIYATDIKNKTSFLHATEDALVIRSIVHERDIENIQELIKLARDNNNAPILIEKLGELSCFGFTDEGWKFTPLNCNSSKFKEKMKFPGIHEKSIVLQNHEVPEELWEIIHAQKAHISRLKMPIHQMHNDPNGMSRGNSIYLNLVQPHTMLEKEWAKRLGPIFGIRNIRCIAELNENGTTYKLKSIEHLALGLTFVMNEKQELKCKEFPGYHLSTQASLEALHGHQGIIILENNKGHKRYLLPAFKLAPGEKNNALNYKSFIDQDTLCNPKRPYYEFTLDKHNELFSESIEANLYLAILYRSQGDFERACKYLSRCHMHHNIDDEVVKIAKQVLLRKMQSPVGAAFDLKLGLYLEEHGKKWSQNNENKSAAVDLAWQKHLFEQLNFYKSAFSNYKEGIAMVPRYARLSEEDIQQISGKSTENKTEVQNETTNIKTAERSKLIAKLPGIITKNDKWDWARRVDDYKKRLHDQFEPFKNLPHDLDSVRLIAEGNAHPAFNFILTMFGNLFRHAVSGEANRIKILHTTLFTLLQNNKNEDKLLNELISMLLFVSKYPQYFSNVSTNSFYSTVQEVGEVLLANLAELKDKTVYLFDIEEANTALKVDKALPSDFIPDTTHFNIAKFKNEQQCKHPLSKISKRYFNGKLKPIAEGDFALKKSDMVNPNLLEQRLFDKFEQGHTDNQTKNKKMSYTVKAKASIPKLRKRLKKTKAEDLHECKRLIDHLIAKANQTPLDRMDAGDSEHAKAHNLILARASEQKKTIAISDLMTAFLQRNPDLLTAQNPFLTQTDVETLFAELSDYALLQSRVDQIDEILKNLRGKKSFDQLAPYQLQLVAGLVDKKRAYDIRKWPEFLVYEYATHRLLREDQVIILEKIIQIIESGDVDEAAMHHALLQFAAGGGKTSVLIPILAQRFSRKEFLPVIFNTHELYTIGLEEIPKNLRESFQQNIEIIERDLDHKWTEKELQQLLKDLARWRSEDKCLLIEPVTWHSINIAMKLAYINRDNKMGHAAKQVLDFFKNKTVKLEDECHLISDPMHQCIKTYGDKAKMPDDQLNLLMRFYELILGQDQNAGEIPKLAGVLQDTGRSITEKELDTLQEQLINIIVKEDIFKTIPTKDLLEYLKNPSKKRPEWLRKLNYNWQNDDPTNARNKKLANLVVLARAFIRTHLPHILSLQYLKDYGASIHEGDNTVAPKHDSQNVKSHFGDHTLVAALSIQLYAKRGLLPEQVDQLLDGLIKEHKEERKWNTDESVPTNAENWLMEILHKDIHFTNMDDITPDLRAQLSQRSDFIKHPEVTKRYLEKYVFPQIEIPTKRIVSTAADMQAGFKRSILFSATPGMPEIYPPFIKPENCLLENAFEAQVIDTLLKPKNKAVYKLQKTQTAKEFFAQFPAELLAQMNTLIDRGALLTDYDPKEIIDIYLSLDKSHTPTQTGAYFSEEHMHLRSTAEDIKARDFKGERLVEELKKQGKDPETFLLFLFLDLSKVTGVNVKRPYSDHAGLTLGKEQTIDSTIQAAMRSRQLLEDDAQTLSWVIFESLYHEIYPPTPTDSEKTEDTEQAADNFDLSKVFYWMIKNQASDIENKIINSAYQSINQIITSICWDRINAKQTMDWDERHSLEESQSMDPYNIYELESYEAKSRSVLESYIKDQLKHLNLKNEDIPPDKAAYLETIITNVSALIAMLQNPPKTQLGTEIEQQMQTQVKTENEQEQEKEHRIKNKNDLAEDFIFAIESYDIQQDNFSKIFENDNYSGSNYQTLQLPECTDIKLPPLLIQPQHFEVIKINKEKNEDGIEIATESISQLKPIKLLLVKIMPNESMQFLACTAAGAEFYSQLINTEFLNSDEPRYALMTTEGEVLQTSNNLSCAEAVQHVQTETCQKMLSYVHLLNGKVFKPLTLRKVINEQEWDKEKYDRIANAVAKVHVSREPINLNNNPIIEGLCGWRKQATQKKLTASRYQPPKRTGKQIIAMQPLQAVKSLPNRMEVADVPLSGPKKAVTVYNERVRPRPYKKPVNAKISRLLGQYRDIKDDGKIKNRKQAISSLSTKAKRTARSLRTSKAITERLENEFQDFKKFDAYLQDLVKKIEKFKEKPGLASLYQTAMSSIGKTYQQIAWNNSIEDCQQKLTYALEAIASETDKQFSRPPTQSTTSTWTPRFFLTPDQEFSTILKKSTEPLVKQSGIKT